MYLTINDFIELCIESSMLEIIIYSISDEEELWSGFACNLPDEYADSDIESFDAPDSKGRITLNID